MKSSRNLKDKLRKKHIQSFQKLSLKEAKSPVISTKFDASNGEKRVFICVKNEVLQTLMEKLQKAKGDIATQEKLAWMIASMPEDKLFSIKVQ